MKKILIGFILAGLMISLLSLMPVTAAEDIISHDDAAGDIENEGFEGGPEGSVDITSVSVDQSSDPVIIELSVSGTIDYNNSEYMFDYQISLNQDENLDPEVDITINPFAPSVLIDEMGGIFSFPYSGQGTDTLTIELTKAQIGADAKPILDVEAYASVARLSSPYGTIEDWVNDGFGGGTETDDDDTTDDDDWPGFDDDDMIADPLSETPTDGSISVSIHDSEMSIDKGDEMFEVEQQVNGSTTGLVHHCSWTMVTYYKDGSYNADDWNPGPEETPRETLLGVTIEGYFYGTGSGGQSDWSSWELYNYAKAPLDWLDQFLEELNEIEDENVSSVVLVVRAYSDGSETLWNQDSIDLTEAFENALKGDDEDQDTIPGFAFSALLISAALVSTAALIFRKRTI